MDFVRIDIANRIASITLNRPEKHNALNPELIAKLQDAFKVVEQDKAVKVVVLKSQGKNFSAGADLGYLQQLQSNTFEANVQDSNRLRFLFNTIYNLEKTVIAQVEGDAIAGGCGLVSACDIVFCVPDVKFGYTEVKIGFVPALVAAFLLRKIGEGRTRELLLSGELIDAKTAYKYGFVNFIEERIAISDAVTAYARKLAESTSSQSIKTTKQLLSKLHGLSIEDSLSYASKVNAKARLTDDFKKGLDSFLNKKSPKW